jgi:hypothetical protein
MRRRLAEADLAKREEKHVRARQKKTYIPLASDEFVGRQLA